MKDGTHPGNLNKDKGGGEREEAEQGPLNLGRFWQSGGSAT